MAYVIIVHSTKFLLMEFVNVKVVLPDIQEQIDVRLNVVQIK